MGDSNVICVFTFIKDKKTKKKIKQEKGGIFQEAVLQIV